MIVTLIVVCEVGFWVLLALGLSLRYLARLPRLGAGVLLLEPLLEVVLLVVTAVDLKNGAEPDWKHGLAALYIGFTVAYGHYTIKWVDGHFAHRFAGGPPPVKAPRYGSARARHEAKLWLRTLLAAAVAAVLLQFAIWYVDDPGRTTSLTDWQTTAGRAVAIHGLIALSYTIWQKKPPKGEEGAERRPPVRVDR
ncbi:hypothetical protein [Streptomyces sp. MUM 178J]|uniref:hypothetical protein n=1 Tax=Streptomyces sp. MUM 178J TaxID=2791991 RepID=UPI001F045ABE|nr:hypothetical protein [Streptomyces sp. MUM 178J]WRQ81214.1 hypothetical protein I3F59_018730 [Streptomyces sp. MUM 178J]